MIRELLHAYGSTRRREFGPDRRFWTGSSEVGRCLRQVAFGKHEAYEPDPEFVESWGFTLRGTVMEDCFWVPALRASLPPGAVLKYAGEEQETIGDEYLSATTDGVVVGLPQDCLASLGVEDTGPGGIVVECKSLDPRYTGILPKAEHTAQVQAAMGIIRKSWYPECPEYAVISYIDASDWSRVQEFVVKFDPAKYQAALDRARAIKFCDNPSDLPAEGKIWGGSECRWCPYQRQCGDGQLARLPEDRGVRLPADAVAELKGLRDVWVRMAGAIADNEYSQNLAQEAIKELLKTHGARAHKETDGSWSVVWSQVRGRMSVDWKALEATGIDLDPYRKEGNPSERLNVKLTVTVTRNRNMNDIVKRTGSGLPAQAADFDPFLAFSGMGEREQGQYLAFVHGEWLYGQDKNVLKLGTKLVANMPGLRFGWRRWRDGKPAEDLRRLVVERSPNQIESRTSLGDNDKTLWETMNGRERDPWQQTMTVELVDGHGEKYILSISSPTGLPTIMALAATYGKEGRLRPGQLPLVELGASFFMHSDKAIGKVHTPLLTVVGWVDGETLEPVEDVGGNDAIPFEGAPEAKIPPVKNLDGSTAKPAAAGQKAKAPRF